MLNGPISSWPCFDAGEKQAGLELFDSNKVNYRTDRLCRQFETTFADYFGLPYAVAVSNGSMALDLAWHALQLPSGSEVRVTSRTFIASVSSIVLAGLTPVFADVDCDSQNISAATIAPLTHQKNRAILCVHLAGWPCDMDDIVALARRHDLVVVITRQQDLWEKIWVFKHHGKSFSAVYEKPHPPVFAGCTNPLAATGE